MLMHIGLLLTTALASITGVKPVQHMTSMVKSQSKKSVQKKAGQNFKAKIVLNRASGAMAEGLKSGSAAITSLSGSYRSMASTQQVEMKAQDGYYAAYTPRSARKSSSPDSYDFENFHSQWRVPQPSDGYRPSDQAPTSSPSPRTRYVPHNAADHAPVSGGYAGGGVKSGKSAKRNVSLPQKLQELHNLNPSEKNISGPLNANVEAHNHAKEQSHGQDTILADDLAGAVSSVIPSTRSENHNSVELPESSSVAEDVTITNQAVQSIPSVQSEATPANNPAQNIPSGGQTQTDDASIPVPPAPPAATLSRQGLNAAGGNISSAALNSVRLRPSSNAGGNQAATPFPSSQQTQAPRGPGANRVSQISQEELGSVLNNLRRASNRELPERPRQILSKHESVLAELKKTRVPAPSSVSSETNVAGSQTQSPPKPSESSANPASVTTQAVDRQAKPDVTRSKSTTQKTPAPRNEFPVRGQIGQEDIQNSRNNLKSASERQLGKRPAPQLSHREKVRDELNRALSLRQLVAAQQATTARQNPSISTASPSSSSSPKPVFEHPVETLPVGERAVNKANQEAPVQRGDAGKVFGEATTTPTYPVQPGEAVKVFGEEHASQSRQVSNDEPSAPSDVPEPPSWDGGVTPRAALRQKQQAELGDSDKSVVKKRKVNRGKDSVAQSTTNRGSQSTLSGGIMGILSSAFSRFIQPTEETPNSGEEGGDKHHTSSSQASAPTAEDKEWEVGSSEENNPLGFEKEFDESIKQQLTSSPASVAPIKSLTEEEKAEAAASQADVNNVLHTNLANRRSALRQDHSDDEEEW